MKTNHFFLIFFSFFLIVLSSSSSAQNTSVLIVEITDTIDQHTVELLTESLTEAENIGAEAVILLLDTPGGGLQQTFEIAELIQNSNIPIISYVYPVGATAWSAGTFILTSSPVAAMADFTIIGSCQPVELGVTGTQPINDSKTINALVEWLQERARMYSRNTTLAKEFITINRNVNATIALELGAIEFVASTIDELIQDLDGYNVSTIQGNITLSTADAEQIRFSPSIRIQIMKFLSNPILTSLLFMLGIFAVIFGISTPGHGAEVFGLIAILLSLVGSGFGISALSIIFIIIVCLLLIIEIFVTPGFGVIGIGGIISLVIGSLFLIPSYPNREWLISGEYMEYALIIILAIVVFIAIFFVFLLYKILEIRKKKTAIGLLIGETAEAVDQITPEKTGYVRHKGVLWKATSESTIEPQTKVIIIEKDNEVLRVKPK